MAKTRGVFVYGQYPGGRGRILAVSVTGWDEEALGQLPYLTGLRTVDVCSDRIPDAGLGQLAKLTGLTCLRLSGPTTDAGLKALAGLKHLQDLDLSSADVTDEGLKALGSQFPELQNVQMESCDHITEAGVADFLRATDFETVPLADRRPKDRSAIMLRKRRP